MPQKNLDQFLATNSGGHDVLDQIGAGRDAVEAWGGSLTVESQGRQGDEV